MIDVTNVYVQLSQQVFIYLLKYYPGDSIHHCLWFTSFAHVNLPGQIQLVSLKEWMQTLFVCVFAKTVFFFNMALLSYFKQS